ncbi:MAG: FixH family protein [Bacteroidales bacterium]
MKIKWHWGTKLLLAMILFMLLLLTFVFLSTQQEFDLVEKDYYPKALEYQEKIDRTNNSKAMGEMVAIENMGELISVSFPSVFNPRDIKGQVVFYRPSGQKDDLVFTIQPDSSGIQLFPVKTMLKGKYIIKLDFEVGGIGYYQEETVFVKMF